MLKESYINSICNKLDHSGKEKKRIRQEMKAKLEEQLTLGKTLKEATEELGDPRSIAEKYNESLPRKTRSRAQILRKFRRLGVFLLVVAVILSLIAYGTPREYEIGEHCETFDETMLVDQARQLARLMGSQSYESIRTDYGNKDFQHQISAKQLAQSYEEIGEDWGSVVAFGEYYAAEVTQMWREYAVISIRTSYTDAEVIFTFTFDTDMKLAGIYLK